MIDNIKIAVKLIGSVIIAVFVLTAIAVVGYVNVKSMAARGEMMYSQNKKAMDERSIAVSLEKMQGDLYHYIAVPADRQKMAQDVNDIIRSVNETVQAYKNRNIGDNEKKIIAEFDAAWPEMQGGYKAIMKAADEGENGEVDRLLSTGSNVVDARVKTFAAVNGLNKFNSNDADAANQVNSSAASKASAFLVIVTVCAVGITLVLGLLLAISITLPLYKSLEMIQELGKGHLSYRMNLKRTDEIGALTQAMDQFADNLQKYIAKGMQKISEGNINIETPVTDDKDEIGPALKKMVETIRDLVKEINFLTKSAMEGKLDVRGRDAAFNGSYQEIVQGVNKTLDGVMGPINEASQVLEKIAGKDMTARMMGDYQGDHARIKESLNMAVENLDKALQQVAIGADQVASASIQVSTGGESLSQGASEQASSLEEVSSSLQEMSSMTKQNTLHAREANGVAVEARESAEKGVQSMSRMSSAINQIKSSSDATAKIVKTIDEIAFQTNLLALNAAVEAARAGDAGKGFAVVAEEVRNLAMRSAEAAKNTSNLIEEAVKNAENGVSINTEVLTNFKDITGKINKVSQVVAEIAAASEQQDQGISQVNRAVEQMNMLTQQNATNAEESASAAQEMSSQSEEMRSMVAGFNLTVSGDFTKALPTGNHSGYMPRNLKTVKKGGKAISGFQPDPRKVIPLDRHDHDVL